MPSNNLYYEASINDIILVEFEIILWFSFTFNKEDFY